ncbi:UDP-4-amino-4-deoxy-L-arabinose--oxoglutarate aminotransferase (EC 2.6.1.87), partial [Pseudomonas sp. FEN]
VPDCRARRAPDRVVADVQRDDQGRRRALGRGGQGRLAAV